MKTFSAGAAADVAIPPLSEIEQEIADLKKMEAKFRLLGNKYLKIAKELHEAHKALESVGNLPLP